jgi:hypothetical protein
MTIKAGRSLSDVESEATASVINLLAIVSGMRDPEAS